MSTTQLKSVWNNIRRSPFQALAAFFVLTITFFVITTLSILVYSSSQVIKYFETRPQIIAFLKDDVTEESILALQSKFNGDSRVKKTIYISKEEALEIYKKATSDNPLLSELVSPAIFPASIEIQVTDLAYAKNLLTEIKENEFVDQVGFTASLGGEDTLSSVVERLRKITWYLRVGGGIFAALLAGTSFLVLIVIIGMRMTTRRGEIEILDLIGATPGFIRKPIVLEALFYSLGGVLAGWASSFVLILYTTPNLVSYFGEIPVLPRDLFELLKIFGVVLSAELFVGFILGVVGSLLAVSRVKK